MAQDLFKDVPSEIIIDILVRLPVRSIATCKCVCKSWLNLLQTDEFVNFHDHSRFSQSCLAVLKNWPSQCRVYELEEEIDAESGHDRHYSHLTTFDFPYEVTIEGSANGLFLLCEHNFFDDNNSLYIVWNPISHEYIELNRREFPLIACGFGVSKISGQYKVVRITEKDNHCEVYTLGTRSWRRVEAAAHASLDYGRCTYPTSLHGFLNGNLHWLVWDSDKTSLISCFDLETECFSTFSLSPYMRDDSHSCENVYTLRDCLCLTELSDGNVDIWLMKEYGDEKSWTKEYVINLHPGFDFFSLDDVRPIKVFKDGDILMLWGEKRLFYYSYKMKTTQDISFDGVRVGGRIRPLLLAPSLLSLKPNFKTENVILPF